MADRVQPLAKPAAAAAPSFPPTKSQKFPRQHYRPKPPEPRRLFCRCCLWTSVILIILAGIASTVFYLIYRPQPPNFSVSSLQLETFNISGSNLLTSRLQISVTARNPNKKLVYHYSASSVSVSSGGVEIGDGSFPAFTLEAGNVTLLLAVAKKSGTLLDTRVAVDLKKKSAVEAGLRMEGMASVAGGRFSTKKVKVRITCPALKVSVPKGTKKAAAAASSAAACKVKTKMGSWYV